MDYPLTQPGLDLYNGKFTDGVPGVRPASVIPSITHNALIDEVLAVIVAGGLVKSEATLTQLRDAIKIMIDAQAGNYCLDTGAANAYVIAMDPPVAAYTTGMTARFRAVNANTGAATLNAGGGVVALKNDVGGALVAGDLLAGFVVTATYDSTAAAFLINSLVPSQIIFGTTPATADNSTKLATTAWFYNAIATVATAAGFAFSFGSNGYMKLPSWLAGFIVQWGISTTSGAGSVVVTLPIAYPTGQMRNWVSLFTSTVSSAFMVGSDDGSTTQLTITACNTTGTGVAVNAKWLSFGR